MNYILVIWTIVATHGSSNAYEKRDWRPIGDFQHKVGCERAAAELGITDTKNFRCLKKTGS